ncbi:MAG: type II toxin-antitoxin system RelE/ParE family toxin [Deltaproteobacteria bacterium]|nr:type II toxin-antitoxin system RelE/ParE family toxin [Deltaproteobacteria bacterium]
MAFKLIWSPTAKFDLKDIAAFIAEDNASAAGRFVRSLFQAVEGDFRILCPVSPVSNNQRAFGGLQIEQGFLHMLISQKHNLTFDL